MRRGIAGTVGACLFPVILRCEPTGPREARGPMTGSASLEGCGRGAGAVSFEARAARGHLRMTG